MEPYLRHSDLTLYQGDALTVLRELPAESVHMCVTSPPYYGLRDYGTGDWKGGDPACDHSTGKGSNVKQTKYPNADNYPGSAPHRGGGGDHCTRCGARRIDDQVGLEPTPEAYVQTLVEIFREVRRVLHPEGTLWLNIGSSYNAGRSGGWPGGKAGFNEGRDLDEIYQGRSGANAPGYKAKEQIPTPWLLGIALQSDGWWLRIDNIWEKSDAMPESVRDRPTKSHEYVLMLTKSQHYYWDREAAKEPAAWERWGRQTTPKGAGWIKGAPADLAERDTRNVRSVWRIRTANYPDAHFAVMPTELAQRCIELSSRQGETVLDPFFGVGTTALAARNLDRRCIGIELSAENCKLASDRLGQLSLLTTAEG